MTKGEISCALRDHWEEQCQLAGNNSLPPCPKANLPVKTMAQPTQPPPGLTHAPVTGKKGRTADGPWEFVDSTPMEGTPPEEVLQEINYVEQIAQEAMTRAAILRQSHGLAPKTHHMTKGSSPKK